MRLLVIPDCHQNIAWVRRILEMEYDRVDHILFLGDLFDTHRTDVATATETAEYFMKLFREESNLTILRGNHDLSYYYLYAKAKSFHGKLKERNAFPHSGFSSNKCYDIAKILSWDFIKSTKLAVMFDGVLYTHAGVTPHHVSHKPNGYDINAFLEEAERANNDFIINPDHSFFWCGEARGGHHNYSGIVWCDFNKEFYASPGLPMQIFGHSKGEWIRKNEQNYCIDCKQTFYAVVIDGQPRFSSI